MKTTNSVFTVKMTDSRVHFEIILILSSSLNLFQKLNLFLSLADVIMNSLLFLKAGCVNNNDDDDDDDDDDDKKISFDNEVN